MTFENAFSLASLAAMVSWLALMVLPRWSWLLVGIRFGVIALLSLLYAVLIFLYFFRVPGGGFNSIVEVRTLFSQDGPLLAGWVHYLAFDLFVGLWISAQADRMGMSRLLQAPILLATFMFGPIGLLIFTVCRVMAGRPSRLARG